MIWIWILLAILASAVGLASAEVIDGNDVLEPSMAIDFENYLHVVYVDEDGNLKYAYKDEDGWHYDIVRYPEENTIIRPAIAVSSNGNPHITYVIDYGNRNWRLMYARIKHSTWTGAYFWSSEIVDSGKYKGWQTPPINPSIVVDNSGYPHISYYDDANQSLKYAYKDENGWHNVTVDTGGVGVFSSITVSSSGYAAIVYYDGVNGDLKYASNSPYGWRYSTLDSSGNVGLYPSITTANNFVHISYYDKTNGDLKYFYGLLPKVVDSDGDVGLYTSIAVDSSGFPHISYYDKTNRNLKYAYKDPSGWHVETVDALGDAGKYTSIALDSNGNPYICYYYERFRVLGSVKCTTKQPTIVNLKGSLTDSNGLPVTTASIRVTIKNLDGQVVHQETFNNAVKNGNLNLMLGAKQELKLWEGVKYYLIIEVDVNSEEFVTADVTFGDDNPAGDVVVFYS